MHKIGLKLHKMYKDPSKRRPKLSKTVQIFWTKPENFWTKPENVQNFLDGIQNFWTNCGDFVKILWRFCEDWHTNEGTFWDENEENRPKKCHF